MTEEEVEIVAEELAKIGGLSWYPGRTRGPLLRTVSERYRERARVAIAAIERLRALRENDAPPEGAVLESPPSGSPAPEPRGRFQVGDTVVYRPPGDQRAVPCRVEKLEERRAYLVPCARPDFGWVSLDDLSLMASKDNDKMHG